MDVNEISPDVDSSQDQAAERSGSGDMLAHATVLVELGWYHDAEERIVQALDDDPGNRAALRLLAKVKHIRGELSQAIACWAQLYRFSPQSQRASTHLAALLHLADDPERSAAEFVALSAQRLATRPAGHLALEDAFRLFVSHRIEDAKIKLDEVALKYRREDRSLYKLALLANAWISELSGDLDGACDTLESMGRERGLETDDDRLLALARLYERKGTVDELEKAIKIISYLENKNQEKGASNAALLGTLASLHQRRGNAIEARSYSERYLAAYRKRMHRPSFEETIRVAARVYLSLPRLMTMSFWSHDVAGPLSERESALASILGGNKRNARTVLARSTQPLDRKYLADLASLDGKRDAATELYLRSLKEDSHDLLVVGHLLESHNQHFQPAIAEYFRSPEIASRTRQALQDAVRRAPFRPSLWEQLASLETICLDTRAADRCNQRAKELAEAAEQKSHPVGRTLSASVYQFIGQAHGLIHELWSHRNPVGTGMGGVLPSDHILGNVTGEMKDGIRNTFYAVREYARSKFPIRTADLFNYNYSFKVPKEDEPSGGLSAGLPAALAFLSVFLQRPIPQTFASSGILVADAHDVLTIRRIGDAEHKVNAAYHRNLPSLLLPRENAEELRINPRVPSEICEEIVSYVSSIDDAVKWVFGADIFVPT